MAGPTKRVAVLDPDGRFGTVDAKDADAVVKAGGKVLTAKQAAAEQLHQDYDQKGTAEKIVGGATALAAGPIAGNALAGSGTIAVAPEVQALPQARKPRRRTRRISRPSRRRTRDGRPRVRSQALQPRHTAEAL